jgi:ZIP family zinc transporter
MIGPLLFSFAAVAATLAGGYVILRRQAWAERNLWRVLAFGSGVLLAMTFLHLLPEAWALSPRVTGVAVVAALVGLFALEQFTVVHACCEVAEHCRVHRVGHGALAALFLHSLGDGMAVAVSFLSSEPLGIAVAIAVTAHKFSDGMTLSALFMGSGRSRATTRRRVILLSLGTPLGVLVGTLGGQGMSPKVMATLLGLAGGGFLYVSMADVLPRIHKSRDILCWVLLVAGVAVSVVLPHP